jgi:anti-anti-sigma regulatory factor
MSEHPQFALSLPDSADSAHSEWPALGLVDRDSFLLHAIEPGRAVVWLFGEIDLALAPDLDRLRSQVRDLAPHLVLDVSQMTFFDTTLMNFIAVVGSEIAVTVRRPPRQLVDLLTICGLRDHVTIANFPGPAPLMPA